MVDEKSPYVLVSVFKEDAKEQDVIQAANKIATIIVRIFTLFFKLRLFLFEINSQ